MRLGVAGRTCTSLLNPFTIALLKSNSYWGGCRGHILKNPKSGEISEISVQILLLHASAKRGK
jgi:hypothetical protein